MSRRAKWILMLVFAPLGLALFVFIGGGVVQYLWNWLLPPIFGLPEITIWQALGLLVLCRILFGGFSAHGSGRAHSRTPEEKERFRKAMRERWGFGPSFCGTKGNEATSTPPKGSGEE